MALLAGADRLRLAFLDHIDAAFAAAAIAVREPEIRNLDAALGADDAQHIVRVAMIAQLTSAMMPFSNCSSAEAQSSVPSALSLAMPGLDRIEERFAHRGAGDEAGHRDRIAADIENAAARQRAGEQAMIRHEARHLEAEARLDRPHFADRAGGDEVIDLLRLRMQATMKASAAKVPALRWAWKTASASKALSAKGFSTQRHACRWPP